MFRAGRYARVLTRRETIAECVLSREDLRQLCVVCTLDPRGTSSLVGKIATVRWSGDADVRVVWAAQGLCNLLSCTEIVSVFSDDYTIMSTRRRLFADRTVRDGTESPGAALSSEVKDLNAYVRENADFLLASALALGDAPVFRVPPTAARGMAADLEALLVPAAGSWERAVPG